MKTFETEKGNIPEGATHYRDECKEYEFSWVKFAGDFMYLWCETYWDETADYIFECSVKPIPQTKEVEWVNGDTVEYHNKHEGEGGILTFVGIHPTHKDHAVLYGKHLSGGYMSAPLSMLSKPETEAERVERERLEVIDHMVSIATSTEFGWAVNDRLKEICAKLYDANYRKESE